MPAPCLLCGGDEGARAADGWHCARCGWRHGDAPDPELPTPRIDVVYYLRWRDRVKIGTTRNPRQRLAVIVHEELLAFERGDRARERERHLQFAALRLGGEWFDADPALLAHATALRGPTDPWTAHARWFSEELRRAHP